MDLSQHDTLSQAAVPAEATATSPSPAEPGSTVPEDGGAPDDGTIDVSAIEVIPVDPYAFAMDVDQLDRHDSIRFDGRALGELSDEELAALSADEPMPEESRALVPVRKGKVPVPPTVDWRDLNIIWPKKKCSAHIRVDEDVKSWFCREDELYGPRMNAVLRAYVDWWLEMDARGKGRS